MTDPGVDAGPHAVLRAEMRKGAELLSVAAPPGKAGGTTSDLTVDEALLLHAAGWAPIDLVCGVTIVSVPFGVWTWGQSGEIGVASDAHGMAVRGAVDRLRAECRRVDGHGVVGVTVEATVRPHHIEVSLVGTAVRPVSKHPAPSAPFASDLSARDFTLLVGAGWIPVDLAFGASFVYAPWRSARAAMAQKMQNIELTNYTQAMYAARELAMERMQQSALAAGGTGVVEVKVSEGPMSFARHAVGFTAWGTAVTLVAASHQYLKPQVILPLDDAVVTFDATSLRGR